MSTVAEEVAKIRDYLKDEYLILIQDIVKPIIEVDKILGRMEQTIGKTQNDVEKNSSVIELNSKSTQYAMTVILNRLAEIEKGIETHNKNMDTYNKIAAQIGVGV
jgi:hypothetical protein